ncbi:MAG: hypothetical protein NT091_00495, partial [Candidatus Falkowbacteria bacterium]|nr:hypothetical protein [Candidatus Falkowbacteria bacterium]
GWNFKVGGFNSGAYKNINIRISAGVGASYCQKIVCNGLSNCVNDLQSSHCASGNFYIDNLKIRPALDVRNVETSKDFYMTQSCRLYPEASSLACEYYDDSGTGKKGINGYCLEHDRAPGNPNACLLWYPVDRVKGDWIDEGVGYSGRVPVYYCTQAKLYMPLKRAKKIVGGMDANGKEKKFENGDCMPADCGSIDQPVACPDGYTGSRWNFYDTITCDSGGWW